MKTKRVLCSLFAVLFLVVSVSVPAFAAQPVPELKSGVGITPRWQIPNDVWVYLDIGGGTASAELSYSLPAGATVTSKKVVIYRSTSSSGSWSQVASGSTYASCSTTSGYWYKAVGTATFKNSSGNTETVNVTDGPYRA